MMKGNKKLEEDNEDRAYILYSTQNLWAYVEHLLGALCSIASSDENIR